MAKATPWLLLLVAACAPAAQPGLVTPVHPPLAPAALPASLPSLAEGQRADGFVARAVYTDDTGRARGARFVHEHTRFVFDYLAIETAPQAYVYATTYPTSDGGAPHTQEHLLLGKGNKGRWLGNYDHVMLAEWSAATWPYRTGYHFHTSAGTDAFWGILHTQLDALLNPDYSDEEIRREVCNFGVARQPDGSLELDEKGTVYNEMVRTYEQASTLEWDVMGRLVYGESHPLALSQGGTPEGIRALTPQDIRAFHDAHYQLANMGMVGAFPSTVSLDDVLAHVGKTLDDLAPKEDSRRYTTEADLPPARGAAPGTVRVVDYPYATADQPSPAALGFPATRHLERRERDAMTLFLSAFGDGESSTLYDALVDQRTRQLEVGITGVWTYVSDDPGQAVWVGVESVEPGRTDEKTLAAVRDLVLGKLRWIASLPDGSPELLAFGERMKSRVIDARRRLDKALDTPPLFGERSTGDFWIRTLADLNRDRGFHKDLSHEDSFDHAMALAASKTNPWRKRLAAWGLLDVPYGVMMHPSPALRRKLDADRESRLAAELTRLKTVYGTQDTQETLRKREADIAQATAAIARAEAEVPMPPFVSNPPMTLDDGLSYRETRVSDVPVVAATFDTMKSSTVGLVLRADGVAADDLVYLSLLPSMLRDVGVVKDGVPIPYDAMNDRLRREVLDLDVSWDASFATGRVSLALTGSGGDVEETRKALGWMRDLLSTPDWRPENLARVRDVVQRAATRLRETMTGPEEYWAYAAAEAYRRQGSPLLAHTASFLTRAHDAFRLSWMLEEPDAAAAHYVASLEGKGRGHDRKTLGALAQSLADVKALPPASRARVARAGRELAQLLADIPDGSLSTDWDDLCKTIAVALSHDPNDGLRGFRRVLDALARAGNARAWIVGSSRSQEALAADLERLVGGLARGGAPAAGVTVGAPVTDRARARHAAFSDARLASLVNPSTANGSLANSAPIAGYDATSSDALVDFLAANVFSGSGTHSFYKRIWGAALAYSGYIAIDPRHGRMHVYSDRCADLPQLMRFLDGEVRHAPVDPRFVDYAVANTFYARTADTFESRAAGMARDLDEGVTPDRVRAFRERLLGLRAKPGLAEAIHARLVPVYAEVIPSLDPKEGSLPADELWFAIGPEAQLTKYEAALKASRGAKTAMLRLYPRDFWL